MARKFSLALAGALLLCCGFGFAPSPNKTESDPKKIQVADVNGKRVRPLESKERKFAVFFFIAHDCPIANRYAPEIKQICADYATRPVTFYVVYVDTDLAAPGAKKHATDYGYPCAALRDPAHKLVKALKAKVTPETVVVGPEGKTLYQGRIDNRYLDYGKMRHIPTVYDLRLALDAALEGKRVAHPRTTAIGCFIPEAK